MIKNKNIRLVIIYAFIIMVAGYFLPAEIDWNASFSGTHSTPFGCKVIYDELPSMMPERQVRTNNLSLYQIRDSIAQMGQSIIIVDEKIEMDSLDVNILLDYIAQGNTALVAAYQFPVHLMDTLNLTVETDYLANDIIREGFSGRIIEHNFFQKQIYKDSSFHLEVDGTFKYFMDDDTTDIFGGLGWVRTEDKVNFIRGKVGKGTIYLHSNPFVFTNYNILKAQGAQYISGIISHVPTGDIIWDEYYKAVNRKSEGKILEVVLAEPPLRWALYITLSGILMALLFYTKRRQRIIPELDPYKNDSRELVETIGNLYYNTSDNKTIASKKIGLLKQEIFRKYKSNDLNVDDANISYWKDKTGLSEEEIKELFLIITSTENSNTVSATSLLSLNNKINNLLNR